MLYYATVLCVRYDHLEVLKQLMQYQILMEREVQIINQVDRRLIDSCINESLKRDNWHQWLYFFKEYDLQFDESFIYQDGDQYVFTSG